MNAVIYMTEIAEKYVNKNMDHMYGEKLLEEALKREYGLNLKYEPRAQSEHGKPFLSLQPGIHYNISHSGKYVVCVLAPQEVGIDIQFHKPNVKFESVLRKIVPAKDVEKIIGQEDYVKAFYTQWVLREAYIKWTGEGFSKDLRFIDLNNGKHQLFEIDPDYSCAVWSMSELKIRMEKVEIELL